MIVPYDGFVGGTYRFPSSRIGSQQALNLYPLVHRREGVRPPYAMTFAPTPGTRTFTTIGTGPITALFSHDGYAYAVSGSEYYRFYASGSSLLIGSVVQSTLPVKIATNGSGGGQNMVMGGGLGYIHTLADDSFVQITDSDFPANIISLSYSDSYFIVAAFGTRRFQFSGRFDGLTWSAGDLAEKTQTTDNIQGLELVGKDMWLIGSKTAEVWYNTGDALVTFAPIQGVLIEHGLLAQKTLCKVGGALLWLGQTEDGARHVAMSRGYNAVRVSHDAVEAIWKTYSTGQDAYAWTYLDAGHTFYVLSFPGHMTWVYDLTTDLWHERGYLNPATGFMDPHLGQCHCHAFEKHLVGSRIDGTIYELSTTAKYDDDDKPIRRVVRSPHANQNQRQMTINRFEVNVDVGVVT